MKILTITDAHFSSVLPGVEVKATILDRGATYFDEERYGFKPGCAAYKYLFCGYRPGLRMDEKTQAALKVTAAKINEVDPDLVMFVGDMFNMGGAVRRDKHTKEYYPQDVYDALIGFCGQINAPTIATPGNGDVYSSETMVENLARFLDLNTKLEKLKSIRRFEVNSNGNIVVESGNTTIAMLNSIVPCNYPGIYDVAENRRFLQHVIANANGDNLILGTHHPPFHLTLNGFQATPIQPYIVNDLEVMFRDVERRSLVISGHFHRYVEQSNGSGVQELMLQPMFYDMNNRNDRSLLGL